MYHPENEQNLDTCRSLTTCSRSLKNLNYSATYSLLHVLNVQHVQVKV